MKNSFYLFICLIFFPLHSLYSLLDSIAITGNPAPFTINSAVAGSQPAAITDTSTTYSASTLLASRRITGALASNMPSGITLQVMLAAPTGATSQGLVTMTTASANLVTNLNLAVLTSGLQITYSFSATVAAAQVTAATNTLTYTIGP